MNINNNGSSMASKILKEALPKVQN